MPISLDNSLRTVTLSDGVQLAIVAGCGIAVAIDIGEEEIKTLRAMNPRQRQNELDRMAKDGWTRTKGMLGYCSRCRSGVSVAECVRCASVNRGMKSIAAWEMCVRQSVMKDTGAGKER